MKRESDSLQPKVDPAKLQKLLSIFDEKLQELVSRCGGLPIVIDAIAESLAREMTEIKWNEIIASMNDGFMKELETKPQFKSLKDLFRWMKSYIGNCLDVLKPCILYTSIFPPDHPLRRRRLVRRWISEGYSKESSNKSLEEYAEEFFSMLVNMSIIQQPPQSVTTAFSDTRMVRCQVNRFLYEYIISRKKEENLVFQLGQGRRVSTQCAWHHLTIWEQWTRDQIVFEIINLSWLRSLTVFGEWRTYFISKTMKLLRVLDLENASGLKDDDLEQMVRLLPRLKFLSLRGCREVCNLPSSLGGSMRQLQSLDLRDTSIVALPASMTKLQKLQYIRAGTILQADEEPPARSSRLHAIYRRRHLAVAGVKVPRELGKLTALHTLGVINAGPSAGKGVLKQIKKLTQLHKLAVSGINRNNSSKFFSSISGHVHLESLSVRFSKGHDGCLDDFSLPGENLQSLKLFGLGNKLQQLRNQVAKLRKLVVEMGTLEKPDMEFLSELPNLCILRLRVKQHSLIFSAESSGLELDTYKKVKILEIAGSSNLHVTFRSKTMKNLEQLKLDCSSGLSSPQLSGLNHLSQLKELLLKGSNDETLKTDLQTQLGNHPNKPVLKLEE